MYLFHAKMKRRKVIYCFFLCTFEGYAYLRLGVRHFF